MSIEPTQLKPCPFCGGEATISSESCGWRVDCLERDCYTRGPWPDDCTEAEAIAAWNTRHSAPAGEVEPVAWMYEWRHIESTEWSSSVAKVRSSQPFHGIEIRKLRPLYTHPAPPADLVELVEALACVLDEGHSYESEGMARDYARKVLAKHTRAQGEG